MGDPLWKLDGFIERLDAWIALESPSEYVRVAVTSWILGVAEDPYRGMRREPEFRNLWFGPIPATEDDDRVVACAYWINEAVRAVRCDSFATLGKPL